MGRGALGTPSYLLFGTVREKPSAHGKCCACFDRVWQACLASYPCFQTVLCRWRDKEWDGFLSTTAPGTFHASILWARRLTLACASVAPVFVLSVCVPLGLVSSVVQTTHGAILSTTSVVAICKHLHTPSGLRVDDDGGRALGKSRAARRSEGVALKVARQRGPEARNSTTWHDLTYGGAGVADRPHDHSPAAAKKQRCPLSGCMGCIATRTV